MKCPDFRPDLSALADNELKADRAERLRAHLRDCPSCAQELSELGRLRSAMRSAGRVPPPPNLALAVRVRLSQRQHSHFYDRLRVRLQNQMEPVALPAAAGLFSALLLFGVLIHSLAIPTPAFTDDVPLQLITKPRVKIMPPLTPLNSTNWEADVVVEAHVDETGRVVDYRLLNGPYDPALISKLNRHLLFTQFDPATSFGIPRHGTAVFQFQSIKVKG